MQFCGWVGNGGDGVGASQAVCPTPHVWLDSAQKRMPTPAHEGAQTGPAVPGGGHSDPSQRIGAVMGKHRMLLTGPRV